MLVHTKTKIFDSLSSSIRAPDILVFYQLFGYLKAFQISKDVFFGIRQQLFDPLRLSFRCNFTRSFIRTSMGVIIRPKIGTITSTL